MLLFLPRIHKNKHYRANYRIKKMKKKKIMNKFKIVKYRIKELIFSH